MVRPDGDGADGGSQGVAEAFAEHLGGWSLARVGAGGGRHHPTATAAASRRCRGREKRLVAPCVAAPPPLPLPPQQ